MAKGDDTASVQVAVRVRPPNSREQGDSGKLKVVKMRQEEQGSQTFVMGEDGEYGKPYKYDYSFQSCDPDDAEMGPWSDQEYVFSTMGKPVIEDALAGRNVCLFAYGQTGAGKSYSMLGRLPEEPGIIPRACQAIFDNVHELSQGKEKWDCKVTLSVIEIYMEQIHDLLMPQDKWNDEAVKEMLKPQFEQDGYVVNSTEHPCVNYEDIQKAIDMADHNRSVKGHKLNATSSRAHSIYTVKYIRKLWGKDPKTGKDAVMMAVRSRINLIDLAGSERTDVAGTAGLMRDEGNAINKSLLALGNCISALSEGKKPNYRDSYLTLLLQSSMTNGRVVMIAAISPAEICRMETLSTLRFADHIKKVKIVSRLNVTKNPVDEIKEQMEQMRLEMQAKIDALRAGGAGQQRKEELLELEQQNQERKAAYERQLQEMQETAKQREEETRKQQEQNRQRWIEAFGSDELIKKEDVKGPMFVNLHEDPRLSETLVYPIKAKNGGNKITVGRYDKTHHPDIILNGVGINKRHCELTIEGEKVYIQGMGSSKTLVNGQPLTSSVRVELKHAARVWMGNNYAMKFLHPNHEDEACTTDLVDYIYAEREVSSAAENSIGFESLPPATAHQLAEAIRTVGQGNSMARDLKREVVFDTKLVKNRFSGEMEVLVLVRYESGACIYWPLEKFQVKMERFSELWEQWQTADSKGNTLDYPTKDDPLDDTEPQLIGETDVWLESVAHMVEQDTDANILSLSGASIGTLRILLLPCDVNGGTGPWDDDDTIDLDPAVMDPRELIGKEISFIVHAKQLNWGDGASLSFGTDSDSGAEYGDILLKYKLDPDDEWTISKSYEGNPRQQTLDFSNKHTLTVTEDTIDRLKDGRLVFQIWGRLDKEAASRSALNLESLAKAKREELEALEAEVDEKRKELQRLREAAKH